MLNIISCEFLEEIIYNLFLNEGREIYNENGTFNRFQIDDTDYDNLSIYESQKRALNNIKKQKGVEYKNIENSYNILIDKKTANEFIYSHDTKYSSYELKYVKYKLSKYLKELIENGKDKIFDKNRKEKHILDAKYGFYKYKITFSIVEKNIESIYIAIVLIRNSYDGKKYLYDILKIKQTKKQELASARAHQFNEQGMLASS